MSPRLEELVVFGVTSIVVALFAWIYTRDRQKRAGFWMLGWIAIFVHFTAPAVDDFLPWLMHYTDWIKVFTLIIAGTFFLLSVSEVFVNRLPRLAFSVFISGAAAVYLTLLWRHVHALWFYAGLLSISCIYGSVQSIRTYSWRSPYLYSMLLLLPYGGWATGQALLGHPMHGLGFYLFSFFYITGLVYFRHFRRITPGVMFTSASFIVWGCVFPVATFLGSRHIGPAPSSFFWDIPKFFVAFGMIFTLFENQTEVANTVARQYQVLFEDNLAAVYVSTFEGRLLNCNSAFLRMYGFDSKEEAMSRPVDTLYSHPSERDQFLEDLGRQGQIVNYECTQRRKEGTLFWILERAIIIPGANGDRVIEGTAIDITERKQNEIALKQSEERFATIFRQSPVGCAIVSQDGVFLNVNNNFLRVLALPAEKVIGKTALELGLWKTQQQRDEFYQRIKAEGSIQNLEVKFKDAAGGHHVGLYFATLVRVGDKECIFGMLLDQTEERELEAKFLQSQKMEALGRLAGGVAHDFNNLLGVIGGYAELLESKLETSENLRRYCTKIIDTTQRASGLTRQLLTFSRKEIVRPTPLQTQQALAELAAILPRLIGEDIELVVSLRASGTVVIDKTHFEQIIFNIVINARDAMPGGGQLFIETEDILRPMLTASGSVTIGQYVAIRIRDTGVGMDEETQLHAFEPFYTTKDVGRGTGLGLATVYGIVQQCQGEISIQSSPRKGTQVTILLPVTGAPEPAPNDDSNDVMKKGQGNILLVEDEAELRNVNAEFLTSLGYKVSCAGSGTEALEMAVEDAQIDLVISDVVMPRMSGREFADRLLQIRPNTKLLYVSGYADDVVLQNGIPMQGMGFLQKPYSLRQLAAKVQSLLSVSARPA
ncbi:MAG TPA: PAS domain S-box protein [Candidatus Angelobacter sp.]|nr:PAS domain S-box protein [Candidatus Angelobacter sp.]